MKISVLDCTKNLTQAYINCEQIDLDYGEQAYTQYQKTLRQISDLYETDFKKTVAAFVALSPSSDYIGNLRSLVSVLEGIKQNLPFHQITVSTFNHNKFRALDYLLGVEEFESPSRGLKIRNFYHNILTPKDNDYVTIDGHMVSLAMGKPLRMKDAGISRNFYSDLAQVFFEVAKGFKENTCEFQASLWHYRKRIEGIKYCPNLDLFSDISTHFDTPIESIRPY